MASRKRSAVLESHLIVYTWALITCFLALDPLISTHWLKTSAGRGTERTKWFCFRQQPRNRLVFMMLALAVADAHAFTRVSQRAKWF